jgi:hypothetical protein
MSLATDGRTQAKGTSAVMSIQIGATASANKAQIRVTNLLRRAQQCMVKHRRYPMIRPSLHLKREVTRGVGGDMQRRRAGRGLRAALVTTSAAARHSAPCIHAGAT